MKAIIVGSGPSARGFVPPAGVCVFAVNGSIEWIARADYWFTLDPSPINMGRMANRKPGVRYVAAVPDSTPLPDGVTRLRRIAGRGAEPKPAGTPEWWLWRWSCVLGLSEDRDAIHTGNSAYGALGLAYHLGFRDVLLVGIDGTDAARVEGGAPGNLSHLPLLFQSATDRVRLRSVSALDGIHRSTLSEFLHE